MAVQSASAQSRPEPLQPRIEAGAKAGTERSMGSMEGWMPLVQDDDSVLYGDIRWMADDEDNQEGNLGVGYRVMQGDHIVGAHGWIDRRRTDRGSNFHQITGGVEFLKEDWDVKANAYIPLNKEKEYATANIGSSSPYMAGTGLFVDTNGTIIEEAQPGGDVEVGYRIPAFEKHIDAIRVYGGGYAFIGDVSDDTVGGRVRASVDINPLINVGARFQYDEPRGSQGFIEATLRFPFTAKKRFQQHGLRARMDESPERDIDIVTGAQVDNGLRKEVINTASGITQRVIHVDNTAAGGGNGSIENPYNTLAAAQAAMLDNDVIYVHAGNGTSTGMDQGIVINRNNVQLIGSGADFVFDTDRFTTRRPGQKPADGTVIVAAGAAPVITNTQTTSHTTPLIGNAILATEGNVSISGVTLSDANYAGISIILDGKSADYINISNVDAINNGILGLSIKALNSASIGTMSITDSNFSTNGDVTLVDNTVPLAGGAYIGGDTGSTIGTISVLNNNFADNFSLGLNVDMAATTVNDVLVQDNTATNNVDTGLSVSTRNAGHIDNVTISQNTSSNNQLNGIYFGAATGGSIADVTVNNNATHQNVAYGTRGLVSDAGSSVGDIHLTDLQSNQNTLGGIDIRNITGGTIDALAIENVTTNYNTQYGVFVQANANAFNTITMDGVTSTHNGAAGVWLQNNAGAAINAATLKNITSTHNNTVGINITLAHTMGNLTLDNVTTSNNISSGLTIQNTATSTLTSATLQGLTLANNGSNGLTIMAGGTMSNVAVSNASITTNGGRGVSVSTSAATGLVNQLSIHDVTSTGNTSGVRISAESSGQINNITANNVVASGGVTGFFLNADTGGSINGAVVSNITANNNSQYGFYSALTAAGGSLTNVRLSSGNFTNNTLSGIALQNSKAGGSYSVDLGSASGSIGQNRSYSNGTRDLQISFATAAPVSAQNNWWGNAAGLQPGRVSLSAGTTVDTAGYLTTDPRP